MNLKRYRDSLIVVLALAVPFWFLRASMKDPRQATGADRFILQIATPIQYAAAALARGISGIWGDYVYLVDVKRDNAALSAQNAQLGERVTELESLEAENRRLKRLLDLKNEIPDEVVTATVITKKMNDFFLVAKVVLDKPSPNIKPNMPVLAPDGVVGTTQKVAGDTVEVRLVVDAGTGVDVFVERTGARGQVNGTGSLSEYQCRVQYMERTDEVAVGDKLVTSGVGTSFPRGKDVCTVTKVTKRDFGIYQEVLCEPTVDFSRLEEVLIIVTEDKDMAAATPQGSASAKER